MWNSKNSNQDKPKDVNDMIALFTKIKEKFGGDSPVLFYRDGYGDIMDESDSCDFDIRLVSNVSLLYDDVNEGTTEARIVFSID